MMPDTNLQWAIFHVKLERKLEHYWEYFDTEKVESLLDFISILSLFQVTFTKQNISIIPQRPMKWTISSKDGAYRLTILVALIVISSDRTTCTTSDRSDGFRQLDNAGSRFEHLLYKRRNHHYVGVLSQLWSPNRLEVEIPTLYRYFSEASFSLSAASTFSLKYLEENRTMSWGFALITAFVYSLIIFERSGWTLICSAEKMRSASMIASDNL